MGDRFRAWLESVLPWYDRDREIRKEVVFKAQIEQSRKVRAAVDHEIADSKRDRRAEMRGSFRRAGQRLNRSS